MTATGRPELRLSGERFRATYVVAGDEQAARACADAIAIEQTLEFSPDLVGRPDIIREILGRVEMVRPLGDGRAEVTLSYAAESAGGELTQLVNVLYGNSSLKPGIRLVEVALGPGLLEAFRGPRFGRAGLRGLVGVFDRPLLATAVKPMGLDPAELAALALAFARGGIDLVKDDHGLADQPFCRFEARVTAVAAAVARGSVESGRRCLYAPNVTASPATALARARFAKAIGAGALLVAPGLCGWDTVRALAAADEVALPIVLHPALLGPLHLDPNHGIAPGVVYGLLARLAGADAVVFPSFGGRFSISSADCREIVTATARELLGIAPCLPMPAGGLTLARVAEFVRFYGPESMLLVGGDLHRHGADLAATVRRFAAAVEGG
ncbi:MAG: hypothetical protein JW751_17245 [Polyangiaceae bacterium]|nr:hypothetical protein [Polyangiaceae bacterium]